MPPLSARATNPHEIVGNVQRYTVPSVEMCDFHMRQLVARLRIISDPMLWRRHREDLDRILDRRCELMHKQREGDG